MEAEYRKWHDEIWPKLVAPLQDAGVSGYSIHQEQIHSKRDHVE
jgi:L-rhamnose mutarotase